MGACPCPRCFVEKENIREMGMVRDMKFRKLRIRVDNHPRRFDVNRARELIYNNAAPLGVTSAGVERILKPTSQVPTEVCSMLSHLRYSSPSLTFDFRMHFRSALGPSTRRSTSS